MESTESTLSTPAQKSLFVSACEPSANVHLAYLAKHLDTSLRICGVFEPEVFADFKHAQPSFTLKDFAIMGFFDVCKKLLFFKRAVQEMSELAKSCDVVLLLDSSSFNLPIAKRVKQSNSKARVVYYILPQVWAWKAWRAKNIESSCDYLCAILPFELDMYPRALQEQRIKYVGHPLLDEITHMKSKPLSLKNGKIAFMPGSRRGEIKRIFPIFAALAKKLNNPKILILPKHFQKLTPQALTELYGEAIKDFEISFDTNSALIESSFAFVCSGTATLEATLIGTPLVLGYKTRALDVLIARAFVRLKHIGLANIFYNALHFGSPKVGNMQIHPEFIQSQLTTQNLLKAYEQYDVEDFFNKAMQIRAYLKHGSAKEVGALLTKLLNESIARDSYG
ncbi:lipid-A-disaccharide synthase [Helicobacter jaachi]|uniref:Lipid-A-disaccharide synthase n=1 Tax=Helicobacter jaachi TaxID=1677920 RepID=A0A4U8TDU8_9HELI|nr:lipid-A-disaccharide synthase [Helicobacter jaachi]TLD97864.1 lipid-A-disaccharide synthase [Helicobacter jaachi]